MVIAFGLAAALAFQHVTGHEPNTSAVVTARTQIPATRAARKLVAQLTWLDANLRVTAYQARTVVRRREGKFLWDCSGMMNYLLRRVAPTAYQALDRERPVAATYARVIRQAPTSRPRDGWRRIADIDDVRPGDVFAWRRPPHFRSKNTGHVGVVLESPRRFEPLVNAYKIRIADASSYTHEADTRDPDGDGGYGHGTMLFVADEDGQVVGYGWRGDPDYVVEAPVYFGRVSG